MELYTIDWSRMLGVRSDEFFSNQVPKLYCTILTSGSQERFIGRGIKSIDLLGVTL